MPAMKPRFFASPARWRAWLARHHATVDELWVGFYKRGSGKPSITWPESVSEALCFGWIDGLRRSLDETSYMIRFTPRRTGSIWSAVNIKRATELSEQGLMSPAGTKAFEARKDGRSEIYSYEQRKNATPTPEFERSFKSKPAAWTFFRAMPAWYQRTATYWVISAKREETRQKRLATLIADCGRGRGISQLARVQGAKARANAGAAVKTRTAAEKR